MARERIYTMNRYKITKQLGDGTYGSVLKGVNRQTGEVRHRFVSAFLWLAEFTRAKTFRALCVCFMLPRALPAFILPTLTRTCTTALVSHARFRQRWWPLRK